MSDKPFYNSLCSLLYALPVKENIIESQIRDINDGIRSYDKIIIHALITLKSMINDAEFDSSQESVSEHSLHSMRA